MLNFASVTNVLQKMKKSPPRWSGLQNNPLDSNIEKII